MALTTILFDLDGTLLPMDNDVFVKTYFGLLAKTLAPHGYEARALVDAVWAGTAAMVANDGRQTNEAVFWEKFAGVFGERVYGDKPGFEAFYANEFQNARSVCGFNPQAAQTIRRAKELGLRLVLATNPLFPAIATRSRIRWAGLNPEDFEWITTYENIGFCKPNPEYYREILRRIGVSPGNCLMVGNDVTEDMAAMELGMGGFVLTDCLINREGKNLDDYPHGGFPELTEYLLGAANPNG